MCVHTQSLHACDHACRCCDRHLQPGAWRTSSDSFSPAWVGMDGDESWGHLGKEADRSERKEEQGIDSCGALGKA